MTPLFSFPILAEVPLSIWETVANAGVPALLMAVAVWWLQKGNRELVLELNKERSERIDVLEQHVEACDTDRRELRDMLLNHLSRQAAAPTIAISQAPVPPQPILHTGS